MPSEKQKPLIFAHVGDLHITKAREQNYKDFLSIISQIAVECRDKLDFVYLPGDNADNGLAEQYALIDPVINMLEIPVFILAGDHDMERGSLSDFYHKLPATQLPFMKTIKDIKCIFLDVCGVGSGGPDFRLGQRQIETLEMILNENKDDSTCALFMHTYPDDLKDNEEKQRLTNLLDEHNIALVDTGHTHYNEIINNGKTIFAATRSTGQIEEGPVGYSLISVDNGVVSWRFKTLEDPFPFVMITAPADYRLFRTGNQSVFNTVVVRATVLGLTPISNVVCTLNDGENYPMSYDGARNDWHAMVTVGASMPVKICVEAVNIDGRPGCHIIELPGGQERQWQQHADGSGKFNIGAWPENGIMGTQLGPNKNAKPAKRKEDK